MDITLDKLNNIFNNAFQEEVNLSISSSKESIPSWDSINHLNLIIELESQFEISFSQSEIEKMTSVNQIISIINKK